MKPIALSCSVAISLALTACTPSPEAAEQPMVAPVPSASAWHVVAWVDEMNDFPHVDLVGDSQPLGGKLSLECSPGGRSVDLSAKGLYLSSVHDPLVSYRFDKRPPVELEHWFAIGDTASPGPEQEAKMLAGFEGAKTLLMEVGGSSSVWTGRFNLEGFADARADFEQQCAKLREMAKSP